MDNNACAACTEIAAPAMAVMPIAAHETDMDRADRSNKRLIVVVIVLVIALVVSNMAWLYAWTRYDYTSETVEYTQDGRGINVIGNDNETRQLNEPEISDTP